MEEDIEILSVALAQLLDEKPQWTEHELIETLQQPPYELFAADALRDTLSLFQTHFLIFHCLYCLRADWLSEQTADIEINTLRIRRVSWQPGEDALQTSDPLASYYLDLSQLTGTGAADVDAMLNDFWDKMAGSRPKQSSAMSFEHACEIMLLAPPLSVPELKRQYRRLIHQYHPDKGGSLVKMQTVKKAYQTLIKQV